MYINIDSMKDYNNTIASITQLAKAQQQIIRQALTSYEPLVTDILLNKTTDQNHIEHVLDGLLDFCFSDSILLLYRKLCRYYLNLNPAATADYINFYREMWDEDGKMGFGKR